jgi:hypothetical protein
VAIVLLIWCAHRHAHRDAAFYAVGIKALVAAAAGGLTVIGARRGTRTVVVGTAFAVMAICWRCTAS